MLTGTNRDGRDVLYGGARGGEGCVDVVNLDITTTTTSRFSLHFGRRRKRELEYGRNVRQKYRAYFP